MYVGCVAQSLPTDRTTPVRLSNTFVQDLWPKLFSQWLNIDFAKTLGVWQTMTILLFEQQLKLSEHGDICLQSASIS